MRKAEKERIKIIEADVDEAISDLMDIPVNDKLTKELKHKVYMNLLEADDFLIDMIAEDLLKSDFAVDNKK